MPTPLLTLPVSVISVGSHGPYVSAPFPAGATGYVINFARTAWPTDPAAVVCDYLIEISFDGGATWRQDNVSAHGGQASIAQPGQWWTGFGTRNDQPVTAPDSVNWLLRMTVNAHQACAATISISSLP